MRSEHDAWGFGRFVRVILRVLGAYYFLARNSCVRLAAQQQSQQQRKRGRGPEGGTLNNGLAEAHDAKNR
jgi:hypothetical protein